MSHEKHSDLNPYEQFNIQLPDAFPEEGMAARAAEALVRSECWTDANPNLNLSSFVTTFMEPEAAEIFKDGSFRNFADPDMYPHTKATEEKCVRWLHELWNGPKDVEPYGAATIGSSEACMLAGLAHKWNWRQAREKAGKDASKPNMVTGGNVQIVWKKFLKYFDVEPRIVPLKPGQYTLTAEQLDEYVDENTICVVGIAGQTFTGEDDDFQAIHDWLDAYEEQTGISIPMHIDAASGGFVNPFLYPEYEWDFRLPRVKSINASGHKFGLVPPGLGWIIFREREVFNEDLVFYVNYLGGEAATATLNFSKSSATVLAQYYNFIRLGREGYTRIMKQTVENAEYIRDRLVATGKFKIMNETQRIPVVALTLNESVTNYNEFDISNKVREHGWILTAYS
ncbi:glutamate decarboxylase, partial [Vibrio breoganii]|uniref:glutamate decarboxylase n=1 Tax=Vibrio breoganii TaxID=553239 RepID=UPI00080E60EF